VHDAGIIGLTLNPKDKMSASRTPLGLYKILFCFEAHVHESILLYPPHPTPALPTPLQYYSTIIEQYTTPPPNSCSHAIHHTILVITIYERWEKKKTPPGNSLGPRGVSWGLATDHRTHTHSTQQQPPSLCCGAGGC